MKFETLIDDQAQEVHIHPEEQTIALGDEEATAYSFHRQANGRYLLREGTKMYRIDNVEVDGQGITFSINGQWHKVQVRDEQDLLMDEMGFKTAAEIGEGELKAPMPGKLLEVAVAEGDEVEMGDAVAILEAMKMENELKAPVAGTVTAVHAAVGDSLDKNALILEIEARG